MLRVLVSVISLYLNEHKRYYTTWGSNFKKIYGTSDKIRRKICPDMVKSILAGPPGHFDIRTEDSSFLVPAFSPDFQAGSIIITS